MTSSDTALRADAARNRASIVCAAATVFARSGSGVPLEEIAREAGVGIATLYRRFPTRDALLETVFEEKMAAYARRAAEAAELARSEPWQAFSGYVTYILEQQAQDPAFADVLVAPLSGSAIFAEHQGQALHFTMLLIERAQAAGVVRSDFHHSDLYVLTLANSGLARAAGSSAVEASRRLGAFVLEGYRCDTDQALPPVPAIWRTP